MNIVIYSHGGHVKPAFRRLQNSQMLSRSVAFFESSKGIQKIFITREKLELLVKNLGEIAAWSRVCGKEVGRIGVFRAKIEQSKDKKYQKNYISNMFRNFLR